MTIAIAIVILHVKVKVMHNNCMSCRDWLVVDARVDDISS